MSYWCSSCDDSDTVVCFIPVKITPHSLCAIHILLSHLVGLQSIPEFIDVSSCSCGIRINCHISGCPISTVRNVLNDAFNQVAPGIIHLLLSDYTHWGFVEQYKISPQQPTITCFGHQQQ